MYQEGNTITAVIIVFLLILIGYWFYGSHNPQIVRLRNYNPSSRTTVYSSSYYPTNSYSSNNVARAYSYSAPQASSSSTSYSYYSYPETYYPAQSYDNCYVSWSDGQSTMTTCEYMQ